MRIALEALFCIWCLGLAVVGFGAWSMTKQLSGESGGSAFFAVTVMCGIVLVISLALRVLL